MNRLGRVLGKEMLPLFPCPTRLQTGIGMKPSAPKLILHSLTERRALAVAFHVPAVRALASGI